MIGVTRDVAVGDTARHPHGSLVFLPFTHHIHDPDLVGIGDGEAFTLRSIAIFHHQIGHYFDGLAGSAGTLQSDIDQRAIIYQARADQLLAAAPCALGNHQAMLVHVSDSGICVRHLGDIAQMFVSIPLDDGAHGAGRMVGGRLTIQLAVEIMGIGGISHHHRPVGRGAFGGNEVSAGICIDPGRNCKSRNGGNNSFRINMHQFIRGLHRFIIELQIYKKICPCANY